VFFDGCGHRGGQYTRAAAENAREGGIGSNLGLWDVRAEESVELLESRTSRR
jgi:hypothetical protein